VREGGREDEEERSGGRNGQYLRAKQRESKTKRMWREREEGGMARRQAAVQLQRGDVPCAAAAPLVSAAAFAAS